ncbi:MAG: hypothetical protein GXO88_06535 [Chlorobi bacterium]|nr:hypothetical protein [Chlorobiota bacterium]
MKTYPHQQLIRIAIIIVIIFSSVVLFASSTPPDPGGDPSGGGNPVGGGAPIGNGTWFLVSAATMYLFWKFRKQVFKRHSILEE